jgi:hypothetical protein
MANALYHFKGDFLDSVAQDQPKGTLHARVSRELDLTKVNMSTSAIVLPGAFSARLNDTKTHVNVRSFVWPGYSFHHQLESPFFCAAYFGNGVRQDDAAFLF